MKLYIETENGQTKNHPAVEENLLHALGGIPENWEPFVRVERPEIGVYQKFGDPEVTYQKVDGVWTDVWSVVDMTEEEKLAKQNLVKDGWAARYQVENFSAWTFDEATCMYVPPFKKPRDQGKELWWCGAENNWKEVPQRPVDENQYDFDFFTWSWIIV